MLCLRRLSRAAALAALLILPVFLGLGIGAAPARAQSDDPEVSVEVFDDALAEDGDWIEHPRYGRVWYPRDVDIDWRPYSVGRWVYTSEHGYLWESEERWGWATYHYGRWDFEPRYGWIWIPGTKWAPAWVEWRTGGGYIGWAPLTPAAAWRDDRIYYTERVDYTAPRWRPFWVFVSEPLFISPSLHRHCEPPRRNITIVNNTTVITNYTTVNRTIINNSVNIKRIETVTNRPVVVVALNRVATPGARQTGQANTVSIFRPASTPIKPGQAPVTGPRPASPGAGVVSGPRPNGAPGVAIETAPLTATAPQTTAPGTAGAGGGGRPAPLVTQPLPAKPSQPVPQTAARPPAPTPDPARAEALRQRQNAERDALRQQQVEQRKAAPIVQQPQVLRDQFRERGEQRRIQQQQRDVSVNRPAPPRIPPPAAAPPPRPAPAAAPAQQQQKKPQPGQPGQPGQPPPR